MYRRRGTSTCSGVGGVEGGVVPGMDDDGTDEMGGVAVVPQLTAKQKARRTNRAPGNRNTGQTSS